MYQLPGEVGAALITRRPELAELLRGRIQRGEELTREEMLGIVEAAIDLAKLQAELEEKIVFITDHLRNVQSQLNGGANMIEKFKTSLAELGQ